MTTVVGHRLGHSPIQAVHNMLCTALIGERPNLKTVSQSMTHDGILKWCENYAGLENLLPA